MYSLFPCSCPCPCSCVPQAALPSQRGTVLAIDMSLFSGVRMLSPTLGSWAMDAYGARAPTACAALFICLYVSAILLGWLRIPGVAAGLAAAGGGKGQQGAAGAVGVGLEDGVDGGEVEGGGQGAGGGRDGHYGKLS